MNTTKSMGAVINIDPSDPDATGASVWSGIVGVIYAAAKQFDSIEDRAKFLGAITGALSGTLHAEFGSQTAASMLETCAGIVRGGVPSAAGRTH